MKIIQISNYYAPFKGSFIPLSEYLAEKVYQRNGKYIFIFPQKSKKFTWCKELQKKYKVYFVED